MSSFWQLTTFVCQPTFRQTVCHSRERLQATSITLSSGRTQLGSAFVCVPRQRIVWAIWSSSVTVMRSRVSPPLPASSGQGAAAASGPVTYPRRPPIGAFGLSSCSKSTTGLMRVHRRVTSPSASYSRTIARLLVQLGKVRMNVGTRFG